VRYIECIHCQKRYKATDKHMAAMGRKKVRCPNCGRSFPIVVYEPRPEESHLVDQETHAHDVHDDSAIHGSR
jgi:predicted Zn finger-like uncharacterized protein